MRPTPAAMPPPMLMATAVAAVARHPRAAPVPRHSRPSLFGSPPGRHRRRVGPRAVVDALAVAARKCRAAQTGENDTAVWGVSAKAPREACSGAPAWEPSPPAAGAGVALPAAPPSGAPVVAEAAPAVAAVPQRRAAHGRSGAVAAATRPSAWELCGGRRCHPLYVACGARCVVGSSGARLLALPPRPPVLARSERPAGAPRAANGPPLHRAPDATASDRQPAPAANPALARAVSSPPSPKTT